eukprot:27221-Pleurochrysis_carterae.AAC.3
MFAHGARLQVSRARSFNAHRHCVSPSVYSCDHAGALVASPRKTMHGPCMLHSIPHTVGTCVLADRLLLVCILRGALVCVCRQKKDRTWG